MATELEDKILRMDDVERMLGLSKTCLTRWERTGVMPARRVFGPKYKGWFASEIKQWLASRPRVGQGPLN